MQKGILLEAVQNTVLDVTVTMAPAGAEVTILEDFGNHYGVAYYDGKSPSTTFYVNANQVRLINV